MDIGEAGIFDFGSSVPRTGTAHAHAYDLAGRRTGVGGSFARANAPQAASPATYNVNNQLTQWKDATLTYDLNGNLTSDGSFAFWIFLLEGSDTWNARNQLVSISGPAPASFQYDPFGRRVSKTIGGTTQYLYDGANPVQEISGSSATANLLTGGVDEYFQRTDSAGARNFLTDALGSTLALADSTGTLQTQYTFEPFGNTSVTGAPTTNTFAFTGRELDSTGLYFYRARYYNPSLQRFLSEDPLGIRGNSVNFYEITYDNPTDLRDPFGLQPMDGLYGPALAWFAVQSPCTQARIGQGVEGLLNMGIGIGKVAGGIYATGQSGGIALGFGIYSIASANGNFGAAFSQLGGAISGNVEGGELGAKASSIAVSPAALGTLLVTGFNNDKADTSAKWEGVLTGVFGPAATGEMPKVPDLLDLAQNSYELGVSAAHQTGGRKDSSSSQCPQ